MVIFYGRPETQNYRVNHTYTVNPVLCGHLKVYKTKILMNNGSLKRTATLMITMFYMKDLTKPRILIPVSSKSVDQCGSCGLLNICKWTVMEAAIL